MKICIVSQEYPPETGGGGIGTQSYLKAHGLVARGHAVHVLSASWDQTEREYNDGAVAVHRIAEPTLCIPGYEPSTYWLAYSSAVACKLHRLHDSIAFDIIQFPEYGGEGFIYQTDTFKYRTAAFVVQLHGPLGMFAEHMGWPDIGSTLQRIGTFMESTVIHNADRVMASSHNTARFCSSHYDYPLDKIEVIHSGIELNRFSPRSGPADPRYPKLLFVGNLTGSKGISTLIDAVIRIRQQLPEIKVRAIGKGSEDYVRQLKTWIAAEGAEDNFEFVGYVPYSSLPDHYAWCDAFVGPSTYEPGPGNVYLEAMASARPVIACNTAGTPEVVRNGINGLLVAPGDAESLSGAILQIAGDHRLRDLLGSNGRGIVEREFSFERYIDKVEAIYLALVNENSK